MAKNEKWIFIVNPTAGGGHGKIILPELEQQIATRSLNAEIVLTERHGHATELSEKPEHYKQMLHFSNIISGFLKVDDGSGNKRRNTSAMFAEIENSDRAPSSSDESSMVDIKKISDALKNAGISHTDPEDDNTKHADTVQLEVKVINKAILNYDVPSPPPDSSNP